MNEHIAHFQRWSNCYLMYSHSNFDRIVKEAVKRQERVKAEEDEATRLNTPYMKQMRDLFKFSDAYFDKVAAEIMQENLLFQGTQWTKTELDKMGKVKIKNIPMTEIIKDREPSRFRRVLASLTPLLKGRLP